MPDDVKTKYEAIKNKAVQSKKDSYIYLAQSCKEMGIIEKGGYLRIGTVEERSKSPVTAESINRPPAASAASSAPARSGDPKTWVRKRAMASTTNRHPQSPEQKQEQERRQNNDNVRAASGLLSLFKKSAPMAMTAQQHQQQLLLQAQVVRASGGMVGMGGVIQPMPENAAFAAALASMGGFPVTAGIQPNVSPGWQQAQLQKQMSYYNAIGSANGVTSIPSAAGNTVGGAGNMNPSGPPTSAAPAMPPAMVSIFPASSRVSVGPDIAAAYSNSSNSSLSPADVTAMSAADSTGVSTLYQAQSKQQMQQDQQAFASLAQQQPQAQFQAQLQGSAEPSLFLNNAAAILGGSDGLLDPAQLAGLGAQLNVGSNGAALSSNGMGGANDLTAVIGETGTNGTGPNSDERMKLLARADYLRYLTMLNRMSATITLAQRQASLLQQHPSNVALQADYHGTLATMNKEMASAKIQATRLQEWQFAINSDSLNQHI